MVKDKISNETARDRFLRLAAQRTQAILDKCRILGNCANPYLYEYTEEDIKRIFKTIEEHVKITRLKFSKDKGNKKFTLEE